MPNTIENAQYSVYTPSIKKECPLQIENAQYSVYTPSIKRNAHYTTDTAQSVSQEWNCAFKQPETLDTALDPFHRITHRQKY
jgi:hypothetical protein